MVHFGLVAYGDYAYNREQSAIHRTCTRKHTVSPVVSNRRLFEQLQNMTIWLTHTNGAMEKKKSKCDPPTWAIFAMPPIWPKSYVPESHHQSYSKPHTNRKSQHSPRMVFRCLSRDAVSFLLSWIFNVNFLTSAWLFLVNMMTMMFAIGDCCVVSYDIQFHTKKLIRSPFQPVPQHNYFATFVDGCKDSRSINMVHLQAKGCVV